MRNWHFALGAAFVCVCCVLPAYDGVDSLPNVGGSSSAGTTVAEAGDSSSTTETMGGKTGSGGSGSNVGGSNTPGGAPDMGPGGADSGTGGSTGGTTVGNNGGTDQGGNSGSSAGGSGGSGGSGGTSNSGGMAGGGMGGMGGAAPSPGCSKYCSGAHSVIVVCGGFNLPPKIDTEAKCLAVCAKATESAVTCWNNHVTNAENGLQDTHCKHAEGDGAVCPVLP